MNYQVAYLKKDKEKPILRRHHWIFSGAVRKMPEKFRDGEVMQVRSHYNKVLGHAYFNTKPKSILGRMINFSEDDPFDSIEKNIRSSISLRKRLFDVAHTNAYRVINGEGDGIPGLLIDRYNNILVLQISTLGIETLKEMILDILKDVYKDEISVIYEKSKMSSRGHEGLSNFEGVLWSKEKNPELVTEVLENDIKFEVDVLNGHKTGFYLDQRNMREYIAKFVNGKKLLNCFSYTGGFSVYGAMNNAKLVTSVDISSEVVDAAVRNFEINDIDPEKHEFVSEDVFTYLESQRELDYDVVILDPPAFAKKKADVGAATSGYKRLNFEAISKMRPGTMLLTCSCSYHVDEDMFLDQVKKAARDANRSLKMLSGHRNAEDHVLNPFHPELDYLKSFLFIVE